MLPPKREMGLYFSMSTMSLPLGDLPVGRENGRGHVVRHQAFAAVRHLVQIRQGESIKNVNYPLPPFSNSHPRRPLQCA